MSDHDEDRADPGVGFDQTNGAVQGLEGESDGTADGDESSRAERDEETDAPNALGQQDAFRNEVYSRDDGPDANP